VKAVKNEEASAVSRLNEEIRMLKEKLAQNVSSGVEGTGVMSEKNKQQLRELEQAVRNTWEAKTKMSEEHEQERQRLLQEQQLAAQQLQSAKERSWMLLEQKGLVELTVAHLKELSKVIQSVSTEIDNWSDVITKAFQLEKSAAEQFMVIQVFRSSIEKDSKQIAKVRCFLSICTYCSS
jgi:tRNA U34 5-carboxymethylaminomethyl modifying GTPase MnmE/TrmE